MNTLIYMEMWDHYNDLIVNYYSFNEYIGHTHGICKYGLKSHIK